ncbi:MAG: hypothetical protein FWG81_09235 [Betaproteobacteria bacterium]|nr:hypothetical protein [Betaproteobacteria bacterium]
MTPAQRGLLRKWLIGGMIYFMLVVFADFIFAKENEIWLFLFVSFILFVLFLADILTRWHTDEWRSPLAIYIEDQDHIAEFYESLSDLYPWLKVYYVFLGILSCIVLFYFLTHSITLDAPDVTRVLLVLFAVILAPILFIRTWGRLEELEEKEAHHAKFIRASELRKRLKEPEEEKGKKNLNRTAMEKIHNV